MPGTKPIAEVKDLYDLIELYAKFDRNNDGLLGPGEVPAEEIAAGDKGGIGSANFDVKDGFLSPWEVAQMRGFKWEDVRPLRIANQLQNRTFGEIESLPQDTAIRGVLFKAGTFLSFHRNGDVREGTLAREYVTRPPDSLPLPAGTTVCFNSEGVIAEATVRSPIEINGSRFEAPARLQFGKRYEVPALMSIEPAEPLNALIVDGVACTRVLFSSLSFQERILREDTRIFFDTDQKLKQSHRGIPLSFWLKGATSTFHHDGVYSRGTLARTAEILLPGFRKNGVKIVIPENSVIDRRTSEKEFCVNTVIMAPPDGEPIRVDGVAFSRLEFDDDAFEMVGKLAQSLPRHNQSQKPFVPGEWVTLFGGQGDEWTCYEDSLECLYEHFPHITFSGKQWDLAGSWMSTISYLHGIPSATRSVIREFAWLEDEKFREFFQEKEKNVSAFADPEGKKIAVRIVSSLTGVSQGGYNFQDFTELGTTQHEAAHIRQYSLSPERHAELISRWSSVAGNLCQDQIAQNWLHGDDGFLTRNDIWPHFGYARGYGCKNVHEDIATQVEIIWDNESLYRELLDEGSRFYRKFPDQRQYASIYCAKLELLREYGFITEEKYREIMPQKPKTLHPAIAAFCAREAVNCP